MIHAIRQEVIVQPGGRIEVCSPELKVGQKADVIVMLKEINEKKLSFSSFIGKGKGCYDSPAKVDCFLRDERDSWE